MCKFCLSNLQDLSAHIEHHGLTTLSYPRVPEVFGPRLPDARRLGNSEYQEESELYYRAAALLYCPFRHPHAFLDEEGSATYHYDRWKESLNEHTTRLLHYHQLHYVGIEAAREYRTTHDDSDSDEVLADEDIDYDRGLRSTEGSQRSQFMDSVPIELYSSNLDVSFVRDHDLVRYQTMRLLLLYATRLKIVWNRLNCLTTTVKPWLFMRSPFQKIYIREWQDSELSQDCCAAQMVRDELCETSRRRDYWFRSFKMQLKI